MFNKKITVPLLTYFTLKVNLTGLNRWIEEQPKIKAIPDRDWKNENTKEYQITLLPIESFTFYHKQANEFSPSIGGIDIIPNGGINCIEWAWTQSHFYVNVSDPRITVFSVPIEEIFCLMKTGKNLSTQVRNDESTISLGSEEKFDDFFVNKSPNFSLRYSNELVSLSVVSSSADDLVNY